MTMLQTKKTCRTYSHSRQELLSDEKLELLGNRFQGNRIFALMGLTFEEYLESPRQYDRISAHLEAGGGCRVVDGALEINHA